MLTPHESEAMADLLSVGQMTMFVPSPVFLPLISLIKPGKGQQILIRAANRIGKTRHAAYLAAKWLIETPGTKGRVVGPTNDHVQKVLGEYLYEFLKDHLAPKSYYVAGKGWNGGRAKEIILSNGSILELRSCQDHPEAHSGMALNFVIFDEPPSRAHLVENQARLVDFRGVLVIAATMVNRPVQYLRKMVEGEDESPTAEGIHYHSTGWIQLVAKFSQVNCPWYPDETINDWLEKMRASPWQWNQRVEGGWEGVSIDRWFVGFTEQNVTDQTPEGAAKVALTYDHGEHAGRQIVLLLAIYGDAIYCLDEHVNEITTTPEEDAKATIEMLRFHGIDPANVDLAVGDVNSAGKGQAGWQVNTAIQKAITTQLRRQQPAFLIKSANKTPGTENWGIRCINYAARRGKFFVHPRCTNLLSTLRNWSGKKTGSDGELAHAADALRYGFIAALGATPTYAHLRFE